MRTLLAATLFVAAPALLVLAILVAAGALGVAAAALAALAIVAGTALVLRPVATGLVALRTALERLESEAGAEPAYPARGPFVAELGILLARVARRSREQRQAALDDLAATRAVLDALPQPLLLLDASRRVIRCNPAATALFGDGIVERDLAAAMRQPALLDAADAVLAGAGGRVLELGWDDGRHFRVRIEPLGPGAILTLHDVTALKAADQLRADFIANASHELRTPLATLLGFIETLLGPAREDAAARERFLGIMKDEAARMSRLVDDLLALSRIEMRQHQPPTTRIELGELLRAIAAAFALRAEARRMRIALDVAPELPAVIGDRDELTQLFQNLLDNAIKYGRAGTHVVVEARAGGLGVAVQVRDEGEGIPAAQIPRLTERFYRIDAARSREAGGTGLGLAIVKHILVRHRGRLGIASKLGRGSTFTVELPAA